MKLKLLLVLSLFNVFALAAFAWPKGKIKIE